MKNNPLKFFLIFFWFFILFNIANSSTNINNCTNLTIANENYFLTADILNSSTSNCINIQANNVTFDCQGHLIEGNGIAMNGILVFRFFEISNSTIKNCRVTNWNGTISGDGNIYIRMTDINTLINVTSFDGYNGIYFDNSNNVTLINISIYNNSITSSLGVEYINITNVNGYNCGVYFSGGGNHILNNVNFNNGQVQLFGTGYSNISNLYIHNYTGNGLYFYNANNNIVTNATSVNNDGGLYLAALSQNNIFLNSTITNNTQRNIWFDRIGTDYPVRNIFYGNNLNSSKIESDFSFTGANINYYNSSLSGQNIGNNWGTVTCVTNETRGDYIVCTNPTSFVINASINLSYSLPIIGMYSVPQIQNLTVSSNSTRIIPVYGTLSMILTYLILFGYFIFG